MKFILDIDSWNRVAQKAKGSNFPSSLAIFPFSLMQRLQKCQKKSKKLMFCPSLRAFFVYSIATYYDQLSITWNTHPNIIQSTSNPPRIVFPWKIMILGLWIMKIGQLRGKLWQFPSYCKVAKSCSLDYWSLMTLKPTKCCPIHF